MRFPILAVCIALMATIAPAQDDAPIQPFQAVHLFSIDLQKPNAEKTVLAAIAEMNRAIIKAGCPDCIYHLWKAYGDAGNYNYIEISFWPGRDMYDKVHNDPSYMAASTKWSDLRSVVKEEVYSRYVELATAK